MGEKNLKVKVMSGLFWSFGERIAAQGVSFILSLILARLLMPSQYGVISLVLVFINIANVFVSSGFGEALIQKKDANEEDFSTIFYCSFAVSVVLYFILYMTAPWVGRFYGDSDLVLVLRVLALKIPMSSVSTIQHAYVSRKMIFKKFFFSTLGGTIISGIMGVLMAYYGFGVWALVSQYLINTVVDTMVLFVTVRWRPKLQFSIVSAKQLVSFGWKLMVAQLINVTYGEIRNLMIGKIYTTADLAYYSKGGQFPSLIIDNVNTSIGKVVFPAMAETNDNKERLKAITRRAMKITSYVIFPLLFGLMAVGDTLITILLTKRWSFCVPYMRIACIYWLFQPVQTANWQAIKALGRSDLCMKLEIVKKIIGVSLLLATMNISVLAMAISNAAFAGISMVINMIPNRKLLGYSMKEQIEDLAPSLVLSGIMGGIVSLFSFIKLPLLPLLLLQVFAGALFYAGFSWILKLDSFVYLFDIISNIVRSKNKHVRRAIV